MADAKTDKFNATLKPKKYIETDRSQLQSNMMQYKFANYETTCNSPSEIDSEAVNLAHEIVLLHSRTGVRTFNNSIDAALFLLLAENVTIEEFVKAVEEEKTKLRSLMLNLSDSELWRYKLLNYNKTNEESTKVDYNSNKNLIANDDNSDFKSGLKEITDCSNKSQRQQGKLVSCKPAKNSNKSQTIDISLAQTMHIPLNHSGALISFSNVKQWINPSNAELDNIRRHIIMQWVEPLQLRQQDIVKATGVGAPYICYLFKDPENSNMTQRRRIEAYSVLNELLNMYNKGIITDNDFINIRNSRIQNRYLKRQSSVGSTKKQNAEKLVKNKITKHTETNHSPISKKNYDAVSTTIGSESTSPSLIDTTSAMSITHTVKDSSNAMLDV